MHLKTVMTAVVLFACATAGRVEAARICSDRKVTATGAPSNLAFFSRSRAKTAWVGKVSRDPRLGPTYAQWLKTQEKRIVCRKIDTQSICIAAALPCRTVGATSTPPPKPSASLRPL